ncbi:hypothetical protein XENORESO_015556 [Xenotaenia resolanae]|uniref:Uncharacterized protein n=1 Tax=Xenotaenia resolanae TaxID=208358 RepID=A0ABV0WRC4_9TELE
MCPVMSWKSSETKTLRKDYRDKEGGWISHQDGGPEVEDQTVQEVRCSHRHRLDFIKAMMVLAPKAQKNSSPDSPTQEDAVSSNCFLIARRQEITVSMFFTFNL